MNPKATALQSGGLKEYEGRGKDRLQMDMSEVTYNHWPLYAF